MFLFDAEIGVYADKTAIDNNKLPDHYYCPLNFSEEFLGQYIGNRHYDNSPVFQSTYKTWEISVIPGLSQSVIKWHSNNILRKLNAINRTHAVAIALRSGLLG